MKPVIKRDNSLLKMFSWPVKHDPKGTKKPQPVVVPLPMTKKPALPEKKEKKKRKRKIHQRRKASLLRSSPSGGRGRGFRDSSDDNCDQATSADLRSPRRRAPRVPGLDVSPPPPADTPNRMRQRRRSGRGRGRQLRCRNRGCADSEQTFSSDRARERHEQERCSVRIQVKNNPFK